MNVDGTPFRTIWLADDDWAVEIIDQTKLPHEFITVRLENLGDACMAIRAGVICFAILPRTGATAGEYWLVITSVLAFVDIVHACRIDARSREVMGIEGKRTKGHSVLGGCDGKA